VLEEALGSEPNGVVGVEVVVHPGAHHLARLVAEEGDAATLT